MKIPQKVYELALDGGYEDEKNNDAERLLDPKFFKALGKAMDLDNHDFGICSITLKREELNPVFLADCLEHREAVLTWEKLWHRFIDALSEGQTPDQFFKQLLQDIKE